ncbi:hypothetical protein OC844_006111 [Tilletia horrida]|nr:hypothetical protein OC844_006111 [Tilletia horrida]
MILRVAPRSTCGLSPLFPRCAYHDAAPAAVDAMRARRRWIEAFEQTTFTTDHFPITFSRSSGPGGQNVNRLNTKATVRLDLARATGGDDEQGVSGSGPLDLSPGRRWLPKSVAGELVARSPYYVHSSHSISISSMRHRTAPANAQDALEKLHAHIQQTASASLVGETSGEQRERVQGLQRKESRKMERVKKKRSDVKAGRGKVAL